jgi:hypothetical protein
MAESAGEPPLVTPIPIEFDPNPADPGFVTA